MKKRTPFDVFQEVLVAVEDEIGTEGNPLKLTMLESVGGGSKGGHMNGALENAVAIKVKYYNSALIFSYHNNSYLYSVFCKDMATKNTTLRSTDYELCVLVGNVLRLPSGSNGATTD